MCETNNAIMIIYWIRQAKTTKLNVNFGAAKVKLFIIDWVVLSNASC